jgi:CRP/FNR family cyclic AMP-dependent transcriptional regulator
MKPLIKPKSTLPLHMDSLFSSGKLSRYHDKQTIYSQGTLANTLFYIQEGGVRLTTKLNRRPAAVTAILGAGDFFGELCLAGFPRRMSTAVAFTDSSILAVPRETMARMLLQKNKISNYFLSYLLSSTKKYRDHVAEILSLSAEQRLARVLLRLADLDGSGSPIAQLPILNQGDLALIVGTTRMRVNSFMTGFRERGFISYNGRGRIEVHKSLKRVLWPR